MNADAQLLLASLGEYLSAKHYSPRTIRMYVSEVRYLFSYYNEAVPSSISQHDIVKYLHFIKTVHGVGRDKCRIACSAFGFFFKHVLPTPYVAPSELYPRKEFRLPKLLSVAQFILLYNCLTNIKHKVILGMFYGSGLRLAELQHLKMADIDRQNNQIKVRCGKGAKDRFTIFPKAILEDIKIYYRQFRPKVYLFEGQIPGEPMSDRSNQHAVRHCMKKAGFEQFGFSAHSLRHSFATHMLDNGNDIHTIKELMGHSNIESTMVYLHLQKTKRAALHSPFDITMQETCK